MASIIRGRNLVDSATGAVIGYLDGTNTIVRNNDTYNASERQIATATRIATSVNTTNKQTMSRSYHIARTGVNYLKLVFGNWRADFSLTEVGVGASANITASIEYPTGTFTQVTFNGAVQGTATDAGQLVSDAIQVTIPKNASFFVRTWYSSTAGILYTGKAEATGFGEAMNFGVTVADQTMGGTVTSGGAGIYTPYAIISMSSKPAVFLASDSRTLGQNDVYTGNTFPDQGNLARSIGPKLAYTSCGIPTDSAFKAITGNTLRTTLAKNYFTHVISGYGVNDVNFQARTGAQAYADLTTLYTQYAPLPVYQITIGPVSTSTDSWATTVNQTTAATNAQRIALNASIRSSLLVSGVFEVADSIETARDSGIWKAPGYTTDGLHESQTACAVIANTGGVKSGDFI